MPTTCSAPGCVFSVKTGYGVPAGMVELQAFNREGNGKIRRYGEIMTEDEARQIGLEEEFLIYFRDTMSFVHLAASHLKHYGEEKVRELAAREEVSFEDLMARIERQNRLERSLT